MKPEIIVVCGPTGVGKTSAAIELAGFFHGEIINADSMQIYKYMDIGTAKPTHWEQAAVPYHLIDIINPDKSFDAAQFAEMAGKRIMRLHQQGIIPFVVGGTGLYIKSLIHGLFRVDPSDSDLLERLKKKAAVHGSAFLHKRLRACDSAAAQRIHPNDTFRIIRALEIYEMTGRPISEHHREHSFADEQFRVLKIGLKMDRERLYDRINHRVDSMINQGLIDEVKSLLSMGYSPGLKSMQAIGYRHMAEYLRGSISWEEALQTLKRDSRRYAKRQLTWFRADSDIQWFEPEKINDIEGVIKNFLSLTAKGQKDLK